MLPERAANVSQYSGSATAIVSGIVHEKTQAVQEQVVVLGLVADEWSIFGVLFGTILGAAGFIVNLYFQWHRSKTLTKKLAELEDD